LAAKAALRGFQSRYRLVTAAKKGNDKISGKAGDDPLEGRPGKDKQVQASLDPKVLLSMQSAAFRPKRLFRRRSR
jgi:hypothetical protein